MFFSLTVNGERIHSKRTVRDRRTLRVGLWVPVLFTGMMGEPAAVTPPNITARAAAVYDMKSGQWIYEKAAEQSVPPASTVKLLTAMVVLDKWRPDRTVRIPASVSKIAPYKLYLKRGERYPVKDLLYALLMRSANDVAHALAVRAAGSERKFAQWMNRKARSIGAAHSRFANPHGLPDPKQRVTARDMALIAAHARNYPLITVILNTRRWKFYGPGDRVTPMENRNKLLLRGEQPVLLGKTGYTHKAGRCFAGYLNESRVPMAIVVYRSRHRWEDLRKLAAWAGHFYRRRIARNRRLLTRTQVANIQRYLLEKNFFVGAVDGVFGPRTLSGLLRYQHARGLKTDGIIGPRTLAFLEKDIGSFD